MTTLTSTLSTSGSTSSLRALALKVARTSTVSMRLIATQLLIVVALLAISQEARSDLNAKYNTFSVEASETSVTPGQTIEITWHVVMEYLRAGLQWS
ncbi:MAG: hypothetical protein ACR2PR_06795, partial [Pseudohongiellaceae bacterium]